MHGADGSGRGFVGGVTLWVVVAASVVGVAASWNAAFLHDDALITLRYAQNWLAGDGVAWNPGDRVEGYTNFLQLLLAVGLGRLGIDLVDALRVIGAGAWLATLATLSWAGLRGKPRFGVATALPVAATAAYVPGVAWVFGGLEAPLVALTITLGGLVLHRALDRDLQPAGAHPASLALAGVAFGFALLARLDTGIFAALACGFVLACGPAGGRARRLAWLVIPLLVVVLPWTAWKLAYYGHLLPNTWWVKGSDPSGWRAAAGLRYVGGFLLAPPFPVLWLAIAAARAMAARRFGPGDAFLCSAIVLHLSWVVYVGGDQMPAWRLAVPIVPLATWLGFHLAWPDLQRLRPAAAAAVLVGSAALVVLQLAWPGVAGPKRNATAFVGAAVADYIVQHWRPGALVALNTAGSTPYHAPGFRYLDMLGLNDAHIAKRPVERVRLPGQRLPGHAKGDGAYVLDQAPDYIILGPASGVPAVHPWFLSDLEISEDPRFSSQYRERRARLDVHDRAGFGEHAETAAGSVLFIWYERRR